MRLLLGAFVGALQEVFWVVVLVISQLYLFGIMATYLYGRNNTDDAQAYFFDQMGGSIDQYFGTIPASMVTLLQILTFDSWIEIVRPIARFKNSAWPFFLMFNLVGAFGFLNLLIGVFSQEISERSDESAQRKKALLERWKKRANEWSGVFFELVDQDHSGLVSLRELEETIEVLEDPHDERRQTWESDRLREFARVEREFAKLGLHLDLVLKFVHAQLIFLGAHKEVGRRRDPTRPPRRASPGNPAIPFSRPIR